MTLRGVGYALDAMVPPADPCEQAEGGIAHSSARTATSAASATARLVPREARLLDMMPHARLHAAMKAPPETTAVLWFILRRGLLCAGTQSGMEPGRDLVVVASDGTQYYLDGLQRHIDAEGKITSPLTGERIDPLVFVCMDVTPVIGPAVRRLEVRGK